MTQSLEILAKATLNTPEFLEFGNEANMVRPVEVEDAMQTACIKFSEWIRSQGFIRCYDSESSWMIWKSTSYNIQHGEWIIKNTKELFEIWNQQL